MEVTLFMWLDPCKNRKEIIEVLIVHIFYFSSIKIVQTSNWKDVATIDNTKAYYLAFSPKGTFLMSWEPFTVSNANPQGRPNLNIFRTENGELVKNFVHKKQGNW